MPAKRGTAARRGGSGTIASAAAQQPQSQASQHTLSYDLAAAASAAGPKPGERYGNAATSTAARARHRHTGDASSSDVIMQYPPAPPRVDVDTFVGDLPSDDEDFNINVNLDSETVRSDWELQQRLEALAERERRATARLYTLCPIPDRLPTAQARAAAALSYNCNSRLTTDGAPPLCARLPLRVPCAAMRPLVGRLLCVPDPSCDDSAAPQLPSFRLMRSVISASRDEQTLALAGAKGEVVGTQAPFVPTSADNVPPAATRLWFGGCNCAVAVERTGGPGGAGAGGGAAGAIWSDAEKLLFADRFFNFPKVRGLQ